MYDATKRAIVITGSRFGDLTGPLCSSGSCPTIVDNVIVYYDVGLRAISGADTESLAA
ncbi:MAG: hypothetical protein M3O55_10265 [Actinomycetota bacterium]|nr:hypothetical protein [Actinomycetota bacterium]